MTDEELLKRVREGDREAFGELTLRYAKPVTLMILRILKDKEDAKDISQQVFLRVYERLPLFPTGPSFKA
ncbi:MAG: RNA polymerase subunit sigma, partial [Pseudomonadota bacterium]